MSNLVDTPRGPKKWDTINKALDALELQPRLIKMIGDLEDHLDYCGWGDRWERECSEELRKELEALNNLLEKEGLK